MAFIVLAFRMRVMVNRDRWGHSYLTGFVKDERLRKHLPMMFSLIKNGS